MEEQYEVAAGAPDPDEAGARARARRRADYVRRVEAAWELRAQAVPWSEIAEQLGYSSPQNAMRACRRWRSEVPEIDIAAARDEAVARCMRLIAEAVVDVRDRRPSAITHQVRAEQLLCSLLGLARPAEVVVYSPTTAELERWVAGVLTSEVPGVVEADVIGELGAGPGELEPAG